MRRAILAMLLVSSMVLAGCFGDGEAIVETEEIKPVWNDYVLIDDWLFKRRAAPGE